MDVCILITKQSKTFVLRVLDKRKRQTRFFKKLSQCYGFIRYPRYPGTKLQPNNGEKWKLILVILQKITKVMLWNCCNWDRIHTNYAPILIIIFQECAMFDDIFLFNKAKNYWLKRLPFWISRWTLLLITYFGCFLLFI